MTAGTVIWRNYIYLAIPLGGGLLGWYLERLEANRMTMFRDKSALYGKTLKPGEPPSWP